MPLLLSIPAFPIFIRFFAFLRNAPFFDKSFRLLTLSVFLMYNVNDFILREGYHGNNQ